MTYTPTITGAITRSRQLRYNQERLKRVLAHPDPPKRLVGLLLQRIDEIKYTMNNPDFNN